MSETGLEVFDKTIQTTVWLDEIINGLGRDRQVAWKALRVVLHRLRDRLPAGAGAHLGRSWLYSCAALLRPVPTWEPTERLQQL